MIEETKMVEETNEYYIYENGNKFSKEKFTKEQAESLIESLVNCTDCTDSKYCTDCTDCTNCSNCIECFECENIDAGANLFRLKNEE